MAKKTYYLWAEHCNGRSVSHPCKHGVYDDPADMLDEVVHAENEQAAMNIGHGLLRIFVNNSEPCDCERHLAPGGEQWWGSVSVIASRTPAPDYMGDDSEP